MNQVCVLHRFAALALSSILAASVLSGCESADSNEMPVVDSEHDQHQDHSHDHNHSHDHSHDHD